MTELTDLYRSEWSSAGPEIMRGVLASSISIESTSSTIAKDNSRCTRASGEKAMLSRK